MKVYYKKSIIEKINDEIIEAKKYNRKIDYIQLNENEWEDFIEYVTISFSTVGKTLTKDLIEVMYDNTKIVFKK